MHFTIRTIRRYWAMIRMVVGKAHAEGIWAGDLRRIGRGSEFDKRIPEKGVDELSVSPGRVLPIRKVIVEKQLQLIRILRQREVKN